MTGQTNIVVQMNTAKTTSSNRWIILFTALTVVGAICWGLQLTQGLQVTNLGVYNMWGLYIIGFMIFTGVAGGSLLLAAIPFLLNINEYKPYGRIASYLAAVSSIVAACIAGIMVAITSFVFSFQVARPLWNNPVQPLSFLIAALIAALAILIILAFILNKSGYIKMPLRLLIRIGRVAALFLCVHLIVVLAETLTGLYPGGGQEYEAVL